MDRRGTFSVVHVLLITLGTQLGPVEAVGVGSSILLHQRLQRHLSFREKGRLTFTHTFCFHSLYRVYCGKEWRTARIQPRTPANTSHMGITLHCSVSTSTHVYASRLETERQQSTVFVQVRQLSLVFSFVLCGLLLLDGALLIHSWGRK